MVKKAWFTCRRRWQPLHRTALKVQRACYNSVLESRRQEPLIPICASTWLPRILAAEQIEVYSGLSY